LLRALSSKVLKTSKHGDYINFSWQQLPLIPNDEKGFPYLHPAILLISFMSFVSHPHWNRLSTEIVESPSHDSIQNPMDTILDNLLQLILFEQGGWPR